jgi:hypothetical protein
LTQASENGAKSPAGRLQTRRSVRPQRSQALAILLLLPALFGCKSGALALAAVTTVRVAAAVAVAAANSSSRYNGAPAREEAEEKSAPETVVEADDSVDRPGYEVPPSPGCSEVEVKIVPPPPPGSPPPPRAVQCNGKVLIRDNEGRWRRYDATADAPAAAH